MSEVQGSCNCGSIEVTIPGPITECVLCYWYAAVFAIVHYYLREISTGSCIENDVVNEGPVVQTAVKQAVVPRQRFSS